MRAAHHGPKLRQAVSVLSAVIGHYLAELCLLDIPLPHPRTHTQRHTHTDTQIHTVDGQETAWTF